MPELSLSAFSVHNEFSTLSSTIIGLGAPYQHDREQVANEISQFPFIPETDKKKAVLALTYPSEDILIPEYRDYVAVLHKYGVEVLFADPGAAYSFDYTCPRDIGFVIGDVFFISNMSVASRADEYLTIQHHLRNINPENIRRGPDSAIYEGGDVILLDDRTVLVGINQRTNDEGYRYIKENLAPLGYNVVAVAHRQLHLDCCLNPLGLGHLLIDPDSLADNSEDSRQILARYQWIEVDAVEREHLATNVLSINPQTVIARDHPACRRVNGVMVEQGYTVEQVRFDGVPATGGSFRCASLVLTREA